LGAFSFTSGLFARSQSKKKTSGPLRCAACNSDRLAIRQLTGIEKILARITGTRKYRCLVCKSEFRAVDRRRLARDAEGRAEGEVRIPV